jgi:amidase
MAEVFDPRNDTFYATNDPIWFRTRQTATRLPGGKVLLAGGRANCSDVSNMALHGSLSVFPAATKRKVIWTEWVKLAILTGQAELVRRGEVSPLELVNEAIGRIERLNPTLNAVIHQHFERARTQAATELPDGPFRGVPFLLKDLGAGNLKGDPIHWGTRFLRDAGYRAPTTSYLVEKFLEAGLVVVGRTNVPEFGAWTTTEPNAYGPTGNPWDTTRSSGGSASAVASRMIPVAHASDGGGSIRIPASECGLVGLKPTRGRISLGPDVGEFWEGMICEFAVTRTIRDAAALLDAVTGPMPGDPYVAGPPTRPYREEGRSAVRRPAHRSHERHKQQEGPPRLCGRRRVGGSLLESLGHRVEPSHPAALEDPELVVGLMRVVATGDGLEGERHRVPRRGGGT